MSATDAGQARDLRPTLVLMTCCLSLFVTSMDVTIVNVALPTIQHEFAASTPQLQWTVDAYSLVVASGLLLSGSMADRFGRRRIFQLGMAAFSLGSICCALATTVHALVLCRMVQAIGGTMLTPVAIAIITNTFTQPAARARAVGIWGAVFGIAMGAGLPAGGLLTQTLGWRSIFWINVPIALLAVVLAALFVPESRAARPRRIDAVGQVLVCVMLPALIAAIIEGPRLGWASGATVALFALAAAALAALVAYELRRHEPLIDLALFRSMPFAGATAIALCGFAGFAAFLFLNSLFLQGQLGYSAIKAGLFTLPVAVGTLVCAPLSGRILAVWGARPPLLCASAATAASALMLTTVGTDTQPLFILAASLMFGVGFGFLNAPITVTAVAGLPRDRAGLAAAIASVSRQTGAALGVALAGTIAGPGLLVHGAAATVGTHEVWWLVFAGSLLVGVLGFVSTSPWGLATTRHVAHLFAGESQV